MEVAILDNPVADLILGNMEGRCEGVFQIMILSKRKVPS